MTVHIGHPIDFAGIFGNIAPPLAPPIQIVCKQRKITTLLHTSDTLKTIITIN